MRDALDGKVRIASYSRIPAEKKKIILAVLVSYASSVRLRSLSLKLFVDVLTEMSLRDDASARSPREMYVSRRAGEQRVLESRLE